MKHLKITTEKVALLSENFKDTPHDANEIPTEAILDPIESLLTTLILERENVYRKIRHYLNPWVSLVAHSELEKFVLTQRFCDFWLSPLLQRKNLKIEALQQIQDLRQTEHLSIPQADQKVSQHPPFYKALHRDFLGFQFFKQRTEGALKAAHLSEQARLTTSHSI